MTRNDPYPRRPPRLTHIFPNYDPPIFFLTFCTFDHAPLLDCLEVDEKLRDYCLRGIEEGKAATGRYVIMPDHVHSFVRIASDVKLGSWVAGLKRYMGQPIRQAGEISKVWQPGFFDHVLRHNESYSEKWQYVYMNPVRKGLVEKPEDWPYQGEIYPLEL